MSHELIDDIDVCAEMLAKNGKFHLMDTQFKLVVTLTAQLYLVILISDIQSFGNNVIVSKVTYLSTSRDTAFSWPASFLKERMLTIILINFVFPRHPIGKATIWIVHILFRRSVEMNHQILSKLSPYFLSYEALMDKTYVFILQKSRIPCLSVDGF